MRKILHTPIKDEDLEALNIGDVVYLTGTLVTCRDVAHRRLIELGRELPVDLKGGAIFHDHYFGECSVRAWRLAGRRRCRSGRDRVSGQIARHG